MQKKNNRYVSFNKEAFNLFLKFSKSDKALWTANFRDLNGAIIRMSTLCKSGRITENIVKNEINRLNSHWHTSSSNNDDEIIKSILGENKAQALDVFDKTQLASVLKICRQSKSISEAGRKLFSISRTKKKHINDTDRLKKYLSKFDITWNNINK